MPNETPTTPPTIDPAAAILALKSPVATEFATPAIPSPGQPAQAPTPAARQYKPSGRKICADHAKLLAQGIHPRDIPHLKYGFWKGCACETCCDKHHEIVDTPGVVPGPSIPPLSLSAIITEEIWGLILTLPHKFMELLCRARKHPPEVVKLWERNEKDRATMGKMGKQLADYYLNMPDFKHKELILAGVYYIGDFATSVASMNMILAQQETFHPVEEPKKAAQ